MSEENKPDDWKTRRIGKEKQQHKNLCTDNHNRGRKTIATNYKPERHQPQAEKPYKATRDPMWVTRAKTK